MTKTKTEREAQKERTRTRRSEISAKKINDFQQKILSRYEENARDLPRRETQNPYKIRISETMSQQTQVSRVIPKYHNFLNTLPNIEALAETDKTTLLGLWSWLGYNSRALRLQKAAQEIIEKHNSQIPKEEKALLSLPGIGPYTAHAIMAFAFNQEVPVLDINIKRVLIISLWLKKETRDKELRNIAITCVPQGQSRLWHNALMDYGALVLTAKKTGIRSAKQSKFIGSKRRVRWSILKELLAKTKEANTKAKVLQIKEMKKKYPHKDFDQIIEKMQKEKIIIIKKTEIHIQN